MKTTQRCSVFETNSSSVHALTKHSKTKEKIQQGLVVDNKLYVDVFCLTGQRFNGEGDGFYIYEDGKRWVAYSRDEKAGLLFGYLANGIKEADTGYETEFDFGQGDYNPDKVKACIDYAQEKLGYDEIIFGEESIPIFGDKGENPFDLGCLSRWSKDTVEDCIKIVQDFIDCIFDDDIWIEVVIGEG